MTETDFGQAFLDAIARLDARFDKVDARFDKVDARLQAHDRRFDAIDARLDKADARLERLEADVGDLRRQIKSWPDLHYLLASVRTLIDRVSDLRNEARDTKIRLDEVFKNMATDAEIGALREDVSTFRLESLQFEIRLRALEERLQADLPTPAN